MQFNNKQDEEAFHETNKKLIELSIQRQQKRLKENKPLFDNFFFDTQEKCSDSCEDCSCEK